MKVASINEIKKELSTQRPAQLLEYCLQLARFKKENKELLSYLLFEAQDHANYISEVQDEITNQFELMNHSNIYLIKKSVRKILRNVNKKIRFASQTEVEIELLMHFCYCIDQYSIPIHQSRQLTNLYEKQFEKIKKCIEKLHPDLQYDFKKRLKS
ncbi:MAG: hypothetical protein ACTHNG_03735 [Ginsengibacter sp.]